VVALSLQIALVEAVAVKGMVLVLIAVALLAFAAGSVLTQQPVTSSRSHASVVVTSRDAGGEEGVDAYGNEITNAVAEYSLDPAGALYERHAPQVEIPRLGSPKS
jgi:hypothetical protein